MSNMIWASPLPQLNPACSGWSFDVFICISQLMKWRFCVKICKKCMICQNLTSLATFEVLCAERIPNMEVSSTWVRSAVSLRSYIPNKLLRFWFLSICHAKKDHVPQGTWRYHTLEQQRDSIHCCILKCNSSHTKQPSAYLSSNPDESIRVLFLSILGCVITNVVHMTWLSNLDICIAAKYSRDRNAVSIKKLTSYWPSCFNHV